jgi:hypothetical protein
MFAPRYLHNLIGALAVTSMFIVLLGLWATTLSESFRVPIIRLGLSLATWFTGTQIAIGVWFVATIFYEAVGAFHHATTGTVLWAGGVLAGLMTFVFLVRATRLVASAGPPGTTELPAADTMRRTLLAPATLMLITLIGMSAGRERVRVGLLEHAGDLLYGPSDVRPQPLTAWLFMVLLVAGIGAIAWMCRITFAGVDRRARLQSSLNQPDSHEPK